GLGTSARAVQPPSTPGRFSAESATIHRISGKGLVRAAWPWQRACRMAPAPVKPMAGSERRAGVWLSVAAYTLWGAFPLYFKALEAPPLEVLANRVLWSASFLVLVLTAQRRVRRLLLAIRSWRVLLGSLL